MLDILDFHNKIVKETDTNLLMDLKNDILPPPQITIGSFSFFKAMFVLLNCYFHYRLIFLFMVK